MSAIQNAMSSVSSTFRPEDGSSSSSSWGSVHSARQLDHLAHAVGQAGDHGFAVVLQVQEVDDLLDLFARLDLGGAGLAAEEDLAPQAGAAVRVAADQQVLQHGGMFEQLDVLEGARDAQARDLVWRLLGERERAVRAGVLNLATGRRVDPADEVEHGGLAGAVGADQREHLALPDVETHVVHSEHAAEAHAEVLGGKEDVVVHGITSICRISGSSSAA
jgi:hypothetical protein